MLNVLIVGAGGFLGAVARYGVYYTAQIFNFTGAWSTLFVNVTGSAALGFVVRSLGENAHLGFEKYLFFATGFLGAFTTFSAFSLDSYNLLQDGKILALVCFVVANIFFSIGGFYLAKAL